MKIPYVYATSVPVSTCCESSTQKPCWISLCKLMIGMRKTTIAVPQNTTCVAIRRKHTNGHPKFLPTRKP